MSADVLPFPSLPGARVIAFRKDDLEDFLFDPQIRTAIEPKAHALTEGISAALWLCRDADARAQERVKQSARAARKAYDGKSEVEQASDAADALAIVLRQLARESGQAKFHLLAEDADLLSQQLAFAMAESLK